MRICFMAVLTAGVFGLAPGAKAAMPVDPPPRVGETMRWEIRYMGIMGGWAWSETRSAADGTVQIECGARSAAWYDAIYSIDDKMISTWEPGLGSVRYQTWFREGRFHQDQDMQLVGDDFTVWRNQERKGEWKETTDAYPGGQRVDDPISAVYSLRGVEGEGPWSWPIFSGKKTWDLQVVPIGRERMKETLLGDVDVVIWDIQTAHEGEVEQRGSLLLYLTDDAQRVPVRMVLRTNLGPVRADLVEYTAASDGSP